MATPAGKQPTLYQSVLADRQNRYNAAIESGRYVPFIFPWHVIPSLILSLSLLFIPRISRQYRRKLSLVIFGVITYLCLKTMQTVKTLNMGDGYLLGMMLAWGVVITVAFTLANDPGEDLSRIELEETPNQICSCVSNKDANVRVAINTGSSHKPVLTRNRRVGGITAPTTQQPHHNCKKSTTRSYRLVWRSHPISIGHSIDWVLDLTTSFRGPNWSWRISSMPPIQAKIFANDDKSDASATSMSSSIPSSTFRDLRRQTIFDLVTYYLLIDAIKTIAITDPYFLGLVPLSSPAPWPWLRQLNITLPIATRLARLGISITGAYCALALLFTLSPLFFAVLLPSLINTTKLTRTPLLEAWMYPTYNHPFTSVLDSGLPGFWGKFWHQIFRFAVSAPSRYLIKHLSIPPKSASARLLQVSIAFTLTGLMHAAASYTSFPPNPTNIPAHPFTGSFLFFVLQAPAVIAQSSFAHWFSANISDVRTWPRVLRRILNGAFVLLWLCTSGPLLADDFARCGLWLTEPVPLSLWRGLGIGKGGGGWLCWHLIPGERWVGLWDHGPWWEWGVAVH